MECDHDWKLENWGSLTCPFDITHNAPKRKKICVNNLKKFINKKRLNVKSRFF